MGVQLIAICAVVKSKCEIEKGNLCTKGPSIKYVTLFLANFYPPLSHFVTHPGTPQKVRHTSRTPRSFSRARPPSTKTLGKSPLYNFSFNCLRGFVWEGLSEGLWFGRFCLEWFLSIPPSVTIHLLQQKVKHHFKFHV